MADDVTIIILAGGSGTRFWPLSRQKTPKQLLQVLGPKPLLRLSVDRVLPLVGPQRVVVVSGQIHGQAVRELLPDLPAENIILEPKGRNTAAAVGLGAWWIKRRQGGGVMAVLPADHLIGEEEVFRRDLKAAAAAAKGSDRLITFGLKPARPETGYGYLEQGKALGRYLGKELFELLSFKEKPDRATAEGYLAAGRYYWNAGMFVWEAEVILNWLERLMPDLARGLAELAPALLSPDQDEVLQRIYPDLPALSIDFGVMEKAGGKHMIAADFSWSDVGSWEEVHFLSPQDEAGNAAPGDLLALEARDCLVHAPGKMVALLGVKDLIVVECSDALLVMDRSRAQEVGRVIACLKEKGRRDLV